MYINDRKKFGIALVHGNIENDGEKKINEKKNVCTNKCFQVLSVCLFAQEYEYTYAQGILNNSHACRAVFVGTKVAANSAVNQRANCCM